jgi:hypothetical protein
MKELMAALNPMRNPAYVAIERLNNRLSDVALHDPFFLQVSSTMLKGMLQSQKMADQWFSMMTGGLFASVPNVAQVDVLKQRVVDLESRIAGIVQRNKGETQA